MLMVSPFFVLIQGLQIYLQISWSPVRKTIVSISMLTLLLVALVPHDPRDLPHIKRLSFQVIENPSL